MNDHLASGIKKRLVLPLVWRWTKRLAVGVMGLVLLLALAGAAYQAIASARDARRYPPPGEFVDVGGYRLHINSTGYGGPTVILDAGLTGWSLDWSWVQPKVAKFTRVCSYDRAGYGWSDTGPVPRDSRQMVRELHALLEKAGVPGPYVLVGHSFGGYNVRLFAHEYPTETAGIVLVDVPNEKQASIMPPSVKEKWRKNMKLLKLARSLSPFGVNRLFLWRPGSLLDNIKGVQKLPGDAQPMVVALGSRTPFLDTLYREMLSTEASSVEVGASSSLPQVPLVVLSAGHEGEKPEPDVSAEDVERVRVVRREMQADLATRCSNSIHITIAKSSHLINLDQPAAVVDAILQVVEAARDGTSLSRVGK
jgi:pimeloyl-ACP methyl ester carboxylesterase